MKHKKDKKDAWMEQQEPHPVDLEAATEEEAGEAAPVEEAPKKKARSKKSRVFHRILLVVCIVVFLTSLGFLIFEYSDYFTANQVIDEVEELLTKEPDPEKVAQMPEGSKTFALAELYAENKDLIGYISIEDTHVKGPVTQTDDNEYYLNHNFYGETHRLGTIFMDYRDTVAPDWTSDNLILYGHSASNGTFFMGLLNYKNLEYYSEHKIVSFDTIYEESDWVIIGAFLANVYESQGELFEYHNFIEADSEQEFHNFITEMNRRSYFLPEIDVDYSDTLLTLSTCAYDFDDARMVVVARKLRDGEKPEDFDNIQINYNPNRYMPDAYYDEKD